MSTSGSSRSTPQRSVPLSAGTPQKNMLVQAGDALSTAAASSVSFLLLSGSEICGSATNTGFLASISENDNHDGESLLTCLLQDTGPGSTMKEKGISPLTTSKLANQGYPKVSVDITCSRGFLHTHSVHEARPQPPLQ